jgi:hypothetical protein
MFLISSFNVTACKSKRKAGKNLKGKKVAKSFFLPVMIDSDGIELRARDAAGAAVP